MMMIVWMLSKAFHSRTKWCNEISKYNRKFSKNINKTNNLLLVCSNSNSASNFNQYVLRKIKFLEVTVKFNRNMTNKY